MLDAQQQVDADLLAAEQALAAADQICAASPTPPASTTTPTPTHDAHDTHDDPTVDDGDASATACRAALQAVLDAQHTVSQSQTALAQASTALDALLQTRASTSSGNGTSPQSRAQSQSPSSSGSGGTGGTGASSSPSAADLIAYQKAVDAAALQLAVAEQAVAQATIASPIAGTVVAVDLAVGDDVTAGSATQTIVVVGAGGYEVTATIGVDDLRAVKVGQAATIVPDGSDRPIKGQVVNIGIAGTSASGTTSYPVVIGIDGDSSGLRNGSIASVAIVTSAATRHSRSRRRRSRPKAPGTRCRCSRAAHRRPCPSVSARWARPGPRSRADCARARPSCSPTCNAALPGSATATANARTNQSRFPGGDFVFGPRRAGN